MAWIFSVDDGDAHVVALADKRLRSGRAAHAVEDRVFVGRWIVDLVPFDRAHVAAAKQMDLAVKHDRRNGAARPRQTGDRLPGIARAVVDKAFGMRAAILLDEAAEGVSLRTDRHAGDMVAGQRKRRFLRPAFRLGIVDLVKATVDPVARIAGDHVNFAHAFDHRMLAHRNRQARLLDPSPGIGRDWGNAGHVTLLVDRRRNAGDVAIEQAGEQRIAGCGLRCGCQCHLSPPGVALVVVRAV